MPKLVAIRFREAGKVVHYSPCGFSLHIGDAVVVVTDQGNELGFVAEEIIEVPEEFVREPIYPIIRMGTPDDIAHYHEKVDFENHAYRVCVEKIAQHKLEMNLVEAESSFDGKKLIFYFTAEGRVDFRELVKDLASVFRTRIELRQIGVRDQARMAGGLGICGRELCCCSFLSEFAPVSIKMAKTQGKSMNPGKISGSCGRLMCCLKFEQEAYEDAHQRLPEQGDVVSTPEGRGVIHFVDYLKETAKVLLEKDGTNDLQLFDCDVIEVLIPKKKKKPMPPCDSCKNNKGKQPKKDKKKPEAQQYSSEKEPLYSFDTVEEIEYLDNDMLPGED